MRNPLPRIVAYAGLGILLLGTSAEASSTSEPTRTDDRSPTYPEISRILDEQGVTQLSFTVEADGTVDKISVAKSSGWARLDAASVDFVSHWLYRPAMQNGVPVAVTHQSRIDWSLSGQPEIAVHPIVEGPDAYPPDARDHHEEGIVSAMLWVDANGHPVEYELKQSCGFADLDATTQTVLTRQVRAKPAAIDGKPFSTNIVATVIWTLDPAEAAGK